jgi:hypothetical protein
VSDALDPRPMAFFYVNQTPDLTLAQLQRIASACLLQLVRDVARWWTPDEIGTDLTKATATVVETLDAVPADSPERRVIMVVALPDPDVAGDLGYHSETPDGRAYARVFTRGEASPGVATPVLSWASISTTTAHETPEAGADPNVDRTIRGLDGIVRDLEIADPVEDQTYLIDLGDGGDPVPVSNFVTPAWFHGGDGPFDFLGNLKTAGELSEGGYITEEINGKAVQVPAGRTMSAAKLHPAGRTARRLAKKRGGAAA